MWKAAFTGYIQPYGAAFRLSAPHFTVSAHENRPATEPKNIIETKKEVQSE
jgi:hypothetical protein